MNATEFVDVIQTEVRDAATADVLSLIERPPGKRPAGALVSLSQWFNGLPEHDKKRVREVAAMASAHATFGFLAVLDGARVIEGPEDRGVLELRYVKSGKSVVLNDPQGKALHELLTN